MSSTPDAATAPRRAGRRRLWAGLLLLALALAGGAAWTFWPRAPDPVPPTIDLSRADPEVTGVINTAVDDVRAKPREAAAWGKLGMLLLAHDFETDAMGVFRTAADLDPNDYRWPYLDGLVRVLFEPDRGLERLRRAAELAPPDRPDPRLKLAELLLERGDLDGAGELAAQALKGAPGTPRAELILARVAAGRGDWALVLTLTRDCANAPGARRAAALLRGEAFAARGERDLAEAEFRRADDAPEDGGWPDPVVAEVERMKVGTAARLVTADRLLEEGRPGEAVALLDDVVRRAPDDAKARLLLGQALVRAGNAPAARGVLENYVTRFPESVEGWFNLGVARFVTGDVSKAADAFRKAIELKPDHALSHFNLGHCYKKLGDKPAAKAAFEQALRCRPDHKPSREALDALAAGK